MNTIIIILIVIIVVGFIAENLASLRILETMLSKEEIKWYKVIIPGWAKYKLKMVIENDKK